MPCSKPQTGFSEPEGIIAMPSNTFSRRFSQRILDSGGCLAVAVEHEPLLLALSMNTEIRYRSQVQDKRLDIGIIEYWIFWVGREPDMVSGGFRIFVKIMDVVESF